MLVQAEFYQVGERVVCDVMCERCGDAAALNVPLAVVGEIAKGFVPVICSHCHDQRCRKCHRFPPQGQRWGGWLNGYCWDCREDEFRATIARLEGHPVAVSE
jgi:hypothetical protein